MNLNTIDKYWATTRIVASRPLQDNPVGLIPDFAVQVARIVVLVSVWRSLFEGREAVGGMTLDAILTYTIAASVFGGQMSIQTALSQAIWEGNIANRFLRPIGIYGQFITEMLGSWVPGIWLNKIPMLMVAFMMDVNPFPASGELAFWFFVSLILGVAVGSALDIIFSTCMMFLEQSVYALTQIRNAVGVLASGAVIPLALFPWNIGDWLMWLPFASLASAPLRIYTGTGDPGFLLMLQAGWALVLWPVGHMLWCHNRERMVSHGG